MAGIILVYRWANRGSLKLNIFSEASVIGIMFVFSKFIPLSFGNCHSFHLDFHPYLMWFMPSGEGRPCDRLKLTNTIPIYWLWPLVHRLAWVTVMNNEIGEDLVGRLLRIFWRDPHLITLGHREACLWLLDWTPELQENTSKYVLF